MTWHDTGELIKYILSTGGLIALFKAIFDHVISKKKNRAELGGVEATTGETFSNSAMAFSKAAKLSADASIALQLMWKNMCDKLVLKIKELEDELQHEKQSCKDVTDSLQKQISELSSKIH